MFRDLRRTATEIADGVGLARTELVHTTATINRATNILMAVLVTFSLVSVVALCVALHADNQVTR
jgi:hypothetical protein